MKKSDYLYVKQGRPFICLQQNPILFVWYVGIKYSELRLYSLRINKRAGFNGFKAIIQYVLKGLGKSRQIRLPFKGQLALAVHRGYKIFDFKNKIVIRVIDQRVDSSLVEEEIKNISMTDGLECAPKIVNVNQEERWYVEEFIVGIQTNLFEESASGSLFELYQNKIVPCLINMMSFKSSMLTRSMEYIDKSFQIADSPKLLDASLDKNKIKTVKNYLKLVRDQLDNQLEKEVIVVFSHGDFSLVNILSTAIGVRVIDWEGARYRGLLYDFFNFFLTEIYYQRADAKIAQHVDTIAHDLLGQLEQDIVHHKERSSISVQFYRNLYYLDRISMLLERRLTDKVLEVILRSIDVFQDFEHETNLTYQ